MIINYESAIEAIESEIKDYTSCPDYKGNKLWQNIVCGLSKSLYVLEDVKRRSSYSKSLANLSKDDLVNIKHCIEGKIRQIDLEEKVKIYRLTIDVYCYYYSTAKAAREALVTGFDEMVDDSDSVKIDIKPIYIPESELSQYEVIK
ncbi:hypothetical protein [Vibrio parahaemolyticus]|uniref:hypothetical protein n=1 Tax=Vibrio parahaemolyticus TaxID=670 RepID=UPI00040B6A40|nr:hypothetical protein [Vibrio parahaemolyticus]